MDVKNKRGRSNIFSNILLGLFIIYLAIIFVLTGLNWGEGSPYDVIKGAFTESTDMSMNVLGPIFSVLLGAEGDNALLMILAFILVAVVIVGTFDSIDIFGGDGQGKWINFFIGIITAIIGVRFMPEDIWGALTAPGNAIIALIIVGTPFAFVFFISMRAKKSYLRRGAWVAYLIFMGYIVFSMDTNKFKVFYMIFIAAAVLMILFDATVTKILYKEGKKMVLQKKADQLNIISRHKIYKNLKAATMAYNDAPLASEDKKQARIMMRDLQKKYEQVGTGKSS